jgi:hypothetical protein
VRPAFPSVVESREADRLGAQYGPDELIRRAALRIRCADCDGLIIAGITYIDRRPLATLREMNDRLAPERPPLGRHWQFGWADRGAVLHARCRARRHVLDLGDVAAYLRRSKRLMKVHHTDEDVARP